jgi:hypothetical protein
MLGRTCQVRGRWNTELELGFDLIDVAVRGLVKIRIVIGQKKWNSLSVAFIELIYPSIQLSWRGFWWGKLWYTTYERVG